MESEDKVNRRWKRVAIRLGQFSDGLNALFERLADFKKVVSAQVTELRTLIEEVRKIRNTPGQNGQDGKDGRDGKDGEPGKPGKDGRDGVDGRDGKDGKDGNPGKDGKQGPKGDDGSPGRAGARGKQGAPGEDGDDGQGVPPGGKAGQFLAKKSAKDFDTEWKYPERPVDSKPTKRSKWAHDVVGVGGVTEARVIELIEANMALDAGEQEWLTAKATVTAAGDTTVLTPTSGKRIVIRKVYALNAPDAADPALIKIKLLDGNGVDEWIRNYGILTRQKRVGAIDAPVVINLDVSGSVAVTVFYEETA